MVAFWKERNFTINRLFLEWCANTIQEDENGLRIYYENGYTYLNMKILYLHCAWYNTDSIPEVNNLRSTICIATTTTQMVTLAIGKEK